MTSLAADQLSPEKRRRWNMATSTKDQKDLSDPKNSDYPVKPKAEDRRSSSGGMFLSPRRLSVPRLSLQTPTRSQLLESLTVQRRKLIRRCTAATLQSEDIESIECSNEADTADDKSAQVNALEHSRSSELTHTHFYMRFFQSGPHTDPTRSKINHQTHQHTCSGSQWELPLFPDCKM